MTNWNFDDKEENSEYFNPEAGKRYALVIAGAKEDVSKNKKTPYLGLSFQTEDMQDAYSKEIYNTPKALYRAQEWFKALGLAWEGNVKVDPPSLLGIRLTAKCIHEVYFTDEQQPDGTMKKKEHKMVRWEDPLPVIIGKGNAAPNKQAAPAEPQEANAEDVPF